MGVLVQSILALWCIVVVAGQADANERAERSSATENIFVGSMLKGRHLIASNFKPPTKRNCLSYANENPEAGFLVRTEASLYCCTIAGESNGQICYLKSTHSACTTTGLEEQHSDYIGIAPGEDCFISCFSETAKSASISSLPPIFKGPIYIGEPRNFVGASEKKELFVAGVGPKGNIFSTAYKIQADGVVSEHQTKSHRHRPKQSGSTEFGCLAKGTVDKDRICHLQLCTGSQRELDSGYFYEQDQCYGVCFRNNKD